VQGKTWCIYTYSINKTLWLNYQKLPQFLLPRDTWCTQYPSAPWLHWGLLSLDLWAVMIAPLVLVLLVQHLWIDRWWNMQFCCLWVWKVGRPNTLLMQSGVLRVKGQRDAAAGWTCRLHGAGVDAGEDAMSDAVDENGHCQPTF